MAEIDTGTFELIDTSKGYPVYEMLHCECVIEIKNYSLYLRVSDYVVKLDYTREELLLLRYINLPSVLIPTQDKSKYISAIYLILTDAAVSMIKTAIELEDERLDKLRNSLVIETITFHVSTYPIEFNQTLPYNYMSVTPNLPEGVHLNELPLFCKLDSFKGDTLCRILNLISTKVKYIPNKPWYCRDLPPEGFITEEVVLKQEDVAKLSWLAENLRLESFNDRS